MLYTVLTVASLFVVGTYSSKYLFNLSSSVNKLMKEIILGSVPVPRLAFSQDRSFDGSPRVSISFPDGYTDTMVLSRYYSNENDRLARTENCNFFGHLEGEPDACIALTGCPGSDDLEFTIMSEHSSDTKFKWNKNGEVQVIESKARGTYLVRRDQGDLNGSWDDEMVNSSTEEDESEINCW